jgi:hypothetical protein
MRPAGAAARIAPRLRLPTAVWSLGLYTLLALLFFGIPVIGHPQTTIIAQDQTDSGLFMWLYGWWPHAVLHGLNPFVTRLMLVPEGFNLQWTTSMPGPSVLLAPVTLVFAPAVTWNTIQLMAPALSAWTAFLLCRHVTGKALPSLIGGYVFGFSPYVLAHLTGGPFLALIALLPALVLLVIRRLEDSLSPRRFVVGMTATLIGQFLISTEVLATATLFGAIAIVIAYWLFPAGRRSLARMTLELGVAYLAMAVLISPFLYYFFFGRHYPPVGTFFSGDLLSFVAPPHFLELTHAHGTGAPYARSGENYLGIPLLVCILAFAVEERRHRSTWLLLSCLAVAAVASLGGQLSVGGRSIGVWMPWHLFADIPVLRYAIPVRFAAFVSLPAALILTMWLALRGGIVRWAAVLVAVAAILPNPGNASWHTSARDPAFFADGSYRAYLRASDHVLTVPVLGANQRWQADTGFAFKLAAGYAGVYPASYTRFPTWNTLLTGVLTPDYALQLRRFVADKGVTAIVVDKRYPGPWRRLFGTLGVHPLDLGGVLLYRLRPASGAADGSATAGRTLKRSSGRSTR